MENFENEKLVGNIPRVNEIIQKIVFFAAAVPFIFMILSYFKIFRIELEYSIGLFVYTFLCGVSIVFLNAQEKLQQFCKYFGMFACCGIVFILFAGNNINPTISLALIPILSCFYSDRKLTFITNCVNFVLICIATVIRFYPENPIPFLIGFLMEVFFLILCTNWLLENFEKNYRENTRLLKIEENLYAELKEKNSSLESAQYKIIQFTGRCLGSHDYFTGRHVIHTKAFVELICRGLKKEGFYASALNDDVIKILSSAAYLHDVGKVRLPQELLNKKSNYSEAELELIKTHTIEGKKLLELLPQMEDGAFNQIAIDMAYFHHEHWDGSGYPCGFAETKIPLCARILAVADSLDNLISLNSNQDTAVFEALKILEDEAGKKYERHIVDVTFKLRSDIEHLVKEFRMQETADSKDDIDLWLSQNS